jgi:hypothetical protein
VGTGGAACTTCAQGTADQDNNPATACSACGEGTVAARDGLTSCADCPEGQWAEPGDLACTEDDDPFRTFGPGQWAPGAQSRSLCPLVT